MPNWHEPARLAELVRIVVAVKGTAAPDIAALARAAGLAAVPELVDMPPLTVTSTLIRERIAAGKPVRYLLPEAVEAYIRTNGLYAQGVSRA